MGFSDPDLPTRLGGSTGVSVGFLLADLPKIWSVLEGRKSTDGRVAIGPKPLVMAKFPRGRAVSIHHPPGPSSGKDSGHLAGTLVDISCLGIPTTCDLHQRPGLRPGLW